jgi:outer membrane protein TolC
MNLTEQQIQELYEWRNRAVKQLALMRKRFEVGEVTEAELRSAIVEVEDAQEIIDRIENPDWAERWVSV